MASSLRRLNRQVSTSKLDVAAASPTIRRLARLLRQVDGAWAFALVPDRAAQRRLARHVRAAVAPLPMIDLSLSKAKPDPLAPLLELHAGHPAPVVSITNVGAALPELCGYLDLQREVLARLPHRLLFWVTDEECRYLAEHAPNFFSRLSGVFTLAGERQLVSRS